MPLPSIKFIDVLNVNYVEMWYAIFYSATTTMKSLFKLSMMSELHYERVIARAKVSQEKCGQNRFSNQVY